MKKHVSAIIRLIHIIYIFLSITNCWCLSFLSTVLSDDDTGPQNQDDVQDPPAGMRTPQPLRLLDLPFRLEYVLLSSFGLSPFQTLFHSVRLESLDLPPLPDRSDFDVHGALEDDKVKTKLCYVLCQGVR